MIPPTGLYSQSTGQITTENNGRMDKEDFLSMLVAQMRHQDPLNPMDNTQLAANLAQFSQLEQMLNMTQAFTNMSTVAMLGRNIKATASDGSLITGQVVVVALNEDVPIVKLDNGALVALRDIEEVAF